MWNWKSKFCLIVLICLVQNGSARTRIDPLVDSKVGLIRGLSATDGDYSMFMGIPYATVNESNPFGPSVPHSGFDDVFEAYDDSIICPQVEEFGNTLAGSVDCLNLNVYVPNKANSRNKLPVLVWIYGGGFRTGFASRKFYGPKYLVKQDVILVTFNYRLGPYGFMCLGTPDVPGNQGLKDQILALRWIKDNIDAFGGDADKITIFGESAGAASVDFHLIYGQEKLFDKVIMQSGVGLGPWTVVKPDTSAAIKIASYLGLPTSDTTEALEFLTKTDPKLVIQSSTELGLVLSPCVEEAFDNVEQFIYDYPVNIKQLNLGNTPILLGFNSDEALLIYGSMDPEDYSTLNVFYDFLNDHFNFDPLDLAEMEAVVRQFYIGDEKFSEDVKEGLMRFASDVNFNYPTVRTINKYLENNAKNIYYYIFFYDGGRQFVKQMNNVTADGAAHADEIGYLFDVSILDETPVPEDQLIIDRMTTMWANFAKYGNPTPEVTEVLPVQWPPVTKDLLNYLYIDSELSVQKRNFKSRMAMWNLFYKLNAKYQLGYKENDD